MIRPSSTTFYPQSGITLISSKLTRPDWSVCGCNCSITLDLSRLKTTRFLESSTTKTTRKSWSVIVLWSFLLTKPHDGEELLTQASTWMHILTKSKESLMRVDSFLKHTIASSWITLWRMISIKRLKKRSNRMHTKTTRFWRTNLPNSKQCKSKVNKTSSMTLCTMDFRTLTMLLAIDVTSTATIQWPWQTSSRT